ncbi:MAG: apolipoprotein N-acyltransferase, partial [Deltaproteobacteria bacterium]|nr:apolipoprotein N-acyltransferase [Deltaproteobacteria bacterium]
MWSEGALRSAPDTASGLTAREFSERSGVEVWTGALTRDSRSGKPTVYNSVYRIRDGEVSLPYHKNYLVPISEQMPFSGWLPSLHQLTGAAVGTGGLSAGTELGVFDTDWARVGFVICYEAILDTPTRDSVNAGADLLANFTYEAWFGNTRELDLHLQMAQGQAAQLGVPMVRVATIGITAIIDARGRVVQSGGRFTEEVLVGDVQPL